MSALTAQEWAIQYLAQGWRTVPVPPGGSLPRSDGDCLIAEDVPKYFDADTNVALLLGEPSGGLVAVALAGEPVRLAAPFILPATGLVSGRASCPGSHVWYNSRGAATRRIAAVDGSASVELLSTGELVLVPPSKDGQSGEALAWQSTQLPSVVAPEALDKVTRWLVAAALLSGAWPKGNDRQHAALALAGGLIRDGTATPVVSQFLLAVSAGARDEGARERAACAESTARRLAAGEKAYGWPKLKAIIGAEVVARVHELLAPGGPADPEPPPSGRVEVVQASAVVPSRVRWIWPGYIPEGKLALVDGDPGQGKSTLAYDIAARVSTGSAMPGCSEAHAPAAVLLLSTAEDGIADTIRPRLEAADADLCRIHILKKVQDDGRPPRLPELPGDVERIKKLIHEVGAKLAIIDPITAYLGSDVDTHRDHDVRRALAPLADVAEETGAAILFTRHLNKNHGLSAMYRGGGSIGMVGAVRVALVVASDPAEPSRHVLACIKSNLGRLPPSLRYRLVEALNGASRVEWLDPCSTTADELVAKDEQGALTEAEEFLNDLLGGGPVPAASVLKAARGAAVSEITLRRAKKKLGISAKKLDFKGGWCWVPSGWRPPVLGLSIGALKPGDPNP